MQIRKLLSLIFCVFLTLSGISQTIHHNLSVKLIVEERSIEVSDSLTIPSEFIVGRDHLCFSLNKNLTPESPDGSVEIREMPQVNPSTLYKDYRVEISPGIREDMMISLSYSGVISDDIETGAAEYARGFSETDGTICDSGVYLAGSTFWIPTFEEPLLTFDLTVHLRSDWNVVSQGKRVRNQAFEDKRIVEYSCPHPTEEIYLICAPWTEYEQRAGDVLVQAFLRTPEQELADRYLNATAGYLNMYVDLIGPYPYSKFALVENFWETGYGMPSFTLLGQKVIRFPWILSTSYPHELLHNWWGNSVYVDFDRGNWCEGITVYMADHLLKEQAGQGAEYRLGTLQKYTDYVNEENDFPVIEFRSRNNAAEEAIGYGKCLMFNHMLRKKLGDDKFVNAYRNFYQNNKFRISTFDDILGSFQETSGENLEYFFDQWLKETGAPSLMLSDVAVDNAEGGFMLHFAISQTQEGRLFSLDIPVAVYLKDHVSTVEVVSDKRKEFYHFTFPSEPVKIEVDPQFDVFRKLDKAEVPPSLSQIFGSREALILLPSASPFIKEYKSLAETWKLSQEAHGKDLWIITDDELEKIPDSVSAWILGLENKFAGLMNVRETYRQAFSDAQVSLLDSLSINGSLVFTVPNPGNNAYTLGFVGTNIQEAVTGLARLLPHYGKYSFLGFEGSRPDNVLKGNFPAVNSPLFYPIPYNGKYLNTSAIPEPAKALTE